MTQARVQRLINYWQTLTPVTLAAIDDIYTGDAYFRDPFNEVRGLEKIRRLFDDMFVHLDRPSFTIVETISQDDAVILIWDFDFHIKRLNPAHARRIHGTSHIRFAADGRVSYHRDYWDAAGELYEQLPVIGTLMRWLKKRMG